MSNVATIARRELKAYFSSPLAYIITALFALFTGLAFTLSVLQTQEASMIGSFNWMAVLSLILVPALTMRLFAEENRLGTIELLMTAPVRDWEIVSGKYVAGLVGFIVMLIPTLWQVLVLKRYGNPDMGIIAAGYLGILLLGAAFVAVGMLTSSLTQNQVIAFMLALISMLILWIISFAGNILSPGELIANIFTYLGLPEHFQNSFFNGVIDAQDIIYFLSIVAIGIFVTTRVIESRRWR